MKLITTSAIERMVTDDSWVHNGILSMATGNLPNNPTDIEIAELATVEPEYRASPSLHGFLASAYMGLPADLDDNVKASIEREKLDREGKGYLEQFLDDKTRTLLEMIHSLPQYQNVKVANISAASDYLQLANVFAYLKHDNLQRADIHMGKSFELSKTRPEVFENFIDPIARVYLAQEIIRRLEPDYRPNELVSFNLHRLNVLWHPNAA